MQENIIATDMGATFITANILRSSAVVIEWYLFFLEIEGLLTVEYMDYLNKICSLFKYIYKVDQD